MHEQIGVIVVFVFVFLFHFDVIMKCDISKQITVPTKRF
jgi:hypothetical protein